MIYIENDTYRIIADEGRKGVRLDKFLSDVIENFSRSRLQGLIAEGHVSINGQVCQAASRKVDENDEILVQIPPPVSADPEPEKIALNIVYEDPDLIVLNKPVGLVVHPGAGHQNGTLVNALLYHCGDELSGIGGVMRPGIVHRLDKETSGLMVVAKNDFTHQGLSEQLQDRSLSRKYKALVLGVPIPEKSDVNQPIGRHKGNRLKMAVHKGGREARTHYRVLRRFRDEFSLLECVLESGRTHQIRVHMDYIRHHIIGDPLYGPQPTAVRGALKRGDFGADIAAVVEGFSRQALHAFALEFVHPRSEEWLSFEVDLPYDLANLLNYIDK